MRLTYIMIVALITGTTLSQDFRQNLNKSIFSDQKANRIGDAVTILVVEQLTASNDASTSSSRASDLSLSASGDLSSIGASVGTGNQFKGSGATASHGVVRTKLSARVDSVLENGNLVIQGNRKIVINGEEQSMKISGVVRPSDIQADNSVYSYNISDASIMFEGSGIVSRAQGPGWVTKFLHWLF